MSDSQVQQTSLLNYRPMLSARESVRAAIAMSDGGMTDKEISDATGLEINCVCGRRNELVASGDVVKIGVRQCLITGRCVIVWGLETQPKQEKILQHKYSTKLKLAPSEVTEIIQCLERSIDSRSSRLIQRLQEGC
jgi:hypothetical protein